MNSGIYYIRNPKGKLYIGSTNNFEVRKRQYASGNCKNQTKIYNSIIKYGWDNHQFYEFIYCEEEQLLEKEQMMLDFYKPELNLNPIAAKPPSRLGKTLSEDHKKKISEAQKGRPRPVGGAKKIPVVQYNKKGEFIKHWPSAKDAAESLGINRGNIPSACNGKRKSAGGFIWAYKET
jgi:hypothetical protein